jgi:hypothetical protein
MIKNASDFSDQLMGISVNTVLDDWTWKAFGYKRRPKRGAYFQKFLSEQKSVREKFLVREFFITSCASGLVSLSEKNSLDFRLRIGMHIIDTLLSVEGITKSFNFTSKEEAKDYLNKGLVEYVNKGYDNFTSIFFSRAKIYTEKHFTAAWLVYVARLVTDFDSPIFTIKNTTLEYIEYELMDDIG